MVKTRYGNNRIDQSIIPGHNRGPNPMGNNSHSVYVRLFSDLPVESVKAKITGELKTRYDSGNFISFFETAAELHKWSYSELRAMISKKITRLLTGFWEQ